jgi:hypothetical protein
MITRAPAALRRAPALLIALAVIAVAAPVLTLMHDAPRQALPRADAIAAALNDPASRRQMAGASWDAVTVGAIDSDLVRVSFFSRDQIVAEVAVKGDGRVVAGADFRRAAVPYGNWVAYEPAVLVGLAALFVLVAGVAPLRRIRNLDVAAVLTLLAPVVLLQRRYVAASVLAAGPGLTYLMVRCTLMALGPARACDPGTPLLNALARSVDAGRRIRFLRLLLAALTLVFVMVGVSSPDAVDVIYAVMEGATKLVHGVLPYGHMPGDIIHGDTYPLLSYLLYVPLAWGAPVSSMWDSVDGALAVAVAAALASAWALFRSVAGARMSRRDPRPPELEEAGLRAALCWLSFPPLLITVSTGTTDVVLAAMLLMALLLWRRPAISSTVLAAAAWFKLVPAVLIPIWLAPLRGRRLAAAIAAMVGVSAAIGGVLLALGGAAGVTAMLHSVGYQFSRGSPQSLWAALGISSLQPLGEACLLGLIAAGVVRLRRDPELAGDRTRLAALGAAILVGTQLAAQYWAFLYLVWVLPFMCLSLLQSRATAPHAAYARAVTEQPALRPAWVR